MADLDGAIEEMRAAPARVTGSGPDLARVRAVAAGRRTRRRWWTGASAVVLVVGLVVGTSLLAAGPDEPTVVIQSPSTTAGTVAPTSSTTATTATSSTTEVSSSTTDVPESTTNVEESPPAPPPSAPPDPADIRVRIGPYTALPEGTELRVTGEFDPAAALDVGVCPDMAGDCDMDVAWRTDGEILVALPRHITTPTRTTDCAVLIESCRIALVFDSGVAYSDPFSVDIIPLPMPANPPTLNVQASEPSTGPTVVVSGSNFPPLKVVAVLQCLDHSRRMDTIVRCDREARFSVPVRADGTFVFEWDVRHDIRTYLGWERCERCFIVAADTTSPARARAELPLP